MKTAIVLISETAFSLAQQLKMELPECEVITTHELPECKQVESIPLWVEKHFGEYEQWIFIGAMGICVRSIAGAVHSKYADPAVVCMDSTVRYVIPVLSGHVGGANELSRRVAAIVGAEAVITTQSDRMGIWALDTLGAEYGWQQQTAHATMNECIALLVNGKPTALLLEHTDKGTRYLKETCPSHVTICDTWQQAAGCGAELIIAVTPKIHEDVQIPVLYFRPPVLHVGIGCRKQCQPAGIPAYITNQLNGAGWSEQSVATINTITLKKDEPLIEQLHQQWSWAKTTIYEAEELKEIEVPNPSEKAFEVTGVYGVAEGSALKASGEGCLVIEKQKGVLTEGNHFTYAVALDKSQCRKGHIEIVGAGPGDPELISVRGKRMLQQADLVLYAGSLVPYELTLYAPETAVVRSSASMNLEEQFALMKQFYDEGKQVVRLHTGDPCIYGAIQEQMNYFDKYGMDYHITPGISSFQAAAAALKSQFTIPEKVQSIILTRGEGRTPMPEREQLHKLAQSRSTMCIYLSAAIVEQVQEELLQAYPPETPVAACYKLTWKEEKIYRGQLRDLAKLVRDNELTLTTLLVVGDAIDNRNGLSKLYDAGFAHLFRKSKEK